MTHLKDMIKVFGIKRDDASVNPFPSRSTSDDAEAILLNAQDAIDLHRSLRLTMPLVPFSTVYPPVCGGSDLFSYEMHGNKAKLNPLVTDLWHYSALRVKHRIKYDHRFVSVSDVHRTPTQLHAVLGACLYTDASHTMNSDCRNIAMTEDEIAERLGKLTREDFNQLIALHDQMVNQFGAVTYRRAIWELSGEQLPSFRQHMYHYVLGVAGIPLTNDGYAVLSLRGKSVCTNRGINCPISGGVDWSDEFKSEGCLTCLGAHQMRIEGYEEAGLNLHVSATGLNSRVVPLGWFRELTRGGSLEGLYAVRVDGTLNELIECMRNNTHAGAREIDRFMYAVKTSDIPALLRMPYISSYIHPKALLCLALVANTAQI